MTAQKGAIELVLLTSKFWLNVSTPDRHPETCWPWLGGTNDDGYGIFHFGGEKIYAHRFSIVATHGFLPTDVTVCHQCDFRRCVRPEHLWLGTHEINMKDRSRKYLAKKLVTTRLDCMAAEQRSRRDGLILEFVANNYPARLIARIFGLHHKTVQRVIAKASAASAIAA